MNEGLSGTQDLRPALAQGPAGESPQHWEGNKQQEKKDTLWRWRQGAPHFLSFPLPHLCPPWPRPSAQGRGQQASPTIGSTQLSLTPRLPPSALTSAAGKEPNPLLPAPRRRKTPGQRSLGARGAGAASAASCLALPLPQRPPWLGWAGQGAAERGVRMHQWVSRWGRGLPARPGR